MARVDLGIDGLTDYEVIGSGGFSTVYSAFDEGFRRRVAIKVLHSLDESGRRRFEREREIMGQLSSHPNVVTAFRAGYTNIGAPFIVMELVEGGSLQELLVERGRLHWQEAVDFVVPATAALGHAHDRGILHRDVKPANVLLAGSVPKLTDFGIAAIRESTASQVAYTLAHCPPETFARGKDSRDVRSDVYSMGSTLFTLVNGRPPFEVEAEDSQQAYLFRIIDHPVPMLPADAFPDEFRVLLYRTMAKDPAERPQTAGELCDQLLRVRAQGESSIVTHEPGVRVSRPIQLEEIAAAAPPTDAELHAAMTRAQDPSVGPLRSVTSGEGHPPSVSPGDTGEHRTGQPAARPRRSWRRIALIATTLIVIAAAGIGTWMMLSSTEVEAATTPEVAWEFETSSSLASKPAVSGSTLIIGAHITNTVHAIDTDTGAEQWSFQAEGSIDASPTIAGGTVYIGSADGNLYALDLADGDVVWDYDLGDPIVAGAIVLDDAVVAVSEEGEVVSVERSTGEEIWAAETDDDGLVNATPVLAERDGEAVAVVGTTHGGLYLFAVSDGELIERIPLEGGVWFSSPLAVDRIDGAGQEVWVGTSTERGGLLNRVTLDSADVKTFASSGGVGTNPALTESGLVIVGNDAGELLAIDRTSLGEAWREGFADGNQIKGSPAVDGELVVFGTHEKELIGVTSTDGEALWRFEGEQIFGLSAPIIAEGRVYVGNDSGTVYRLDVAGQ